MTECETESAESVSSVDSAVVRRVIAFVRRRRLFQSGQKIVVAASGGPDSMALLSLLHELQSEWNLELSVVHVNYGLRGRESDGDARFVRRFCDRLAVPCVTRRADLSRRAEDLRGHSLQERARDLRYRILKEVAAEQGADRVALGHTADDQAETILLWLLRGAGLTGLAGMPVVREGLFVRPLLTTTRADLATYLSSRAVKFRTDSTNAKPLYRRNRIRHELMPCISLLAPSFVKLMSRQSEVLGEEDRLLEQLATELLSRVSSEEAGQPVLKRAVLLDAPLALQRRLVRRLLRLLNSRGAAPRYSAVDAILRQVVAGPSGARFALGATEVMRDGTVIRFMRRESAASGRMAQQQEVIRVDIPGSVRWPGTGERINLELIEKARARKLMRVPSKRVAVFDASTFTPPLVLRGWRPGDRFAPTGMNGRQKKLQDFFVDSKVSQVDRRRIPLLTAPEGIVWVAGYRADQRFATSDSTKVFVMASISNAASTEGRD